MFLKFEISTIPSKYLWPSMVTLILVPKKRSLFYLILSGFRINQVFTGTGDYPNFGPISLIAFHQLLRSSSPPAAEKSTAYAKTLPWTLHSLIKVATSMLIREMTPIP